MALVVAVTAGVVLRRQAALPGLMDPLPGGSVARGRAPALPVIDPTVNVPLSDRLPPRLPAAGIPVGWRLREFAGRSDVELVRDDAVALRLRSQGASYVLYRDVVVDVQAHPWLSWSWKIVRLPPGGDVRMASADDQAAQLYVVFPRWPDPRGKSQVIGYVWDTTAPVGTRTISSRVSNVKIIVVASGGGGLGAWQRFQRNLAADYVDLFGRQPPRVGKVAIMIDSNDTRSDAEALISEVRFSRAAPEGKETPTSMLR
jgi:Protein of unknown function (DUF3047)